MTDADVSAPSCRLTRAEVHTFVSALQSEMPVPAFLDRVRAAAMREPIPTNDEALIARYEEVQCGVLDRRRQELDTPCALDGAAILQELKEAIRFYPDAETDHMIRQMCVMEERQLLMLCSTTPALRGIMQQHVGSSPPHPHTCGHQHQHGHGHPHTCGHQHGNPQQMMMMQMAMQSLSPELRQDATRIQQNMQRGQMPSAEDVGKMRQIQSHVSAFMATMQRFNSNTTGGDKKE